MADTARFLTFDLGAESGRAVLGELQDGSVSLEVIHRFPNDPQRILDRFHWDTIRLYAEIKAGLAKCVSEHTGALDGIGVDTWGVDFALLDEHDEALGFPYHYRDARTNGVMEKTFEIVPRDEIYEATGIQFMQLNTLFQLMAMRFGGSRLLDAARSLLFMPDLINFWLTGNKHVEFTIATTSQFYNPRAGGWARDLLNRLGIPTHFLLDIVPPCSVLGELHPTVARETGAGAVRVLAPATHDTGSAVAAVPAQGEGNWAYISCGTWSLVGTEESAPVISEATLRHNLTNEGGIGGTYRLLRNVMGLWLLQQCRRAWEHAGSAYKYEELAAMAATAEPFRCLVNPDHAAFLNPPSMPEAIAEYCLQTGQPEPNGVAGYVRCIVESLALKYRWVLERLEEVTGRRIETVHIIGGGSQNEALCQATADAANKRVLAGPVEATALGNVLAQAIAVGRLTSLDEGRRMIARSFPLKEYLPREPDRWERQYTRMVSLLE